MSGLTDARTGLAATLVNAGLNVVDHVPDAAVPPVVIVSTGQEWIAPADSFDGNIRLTFKLVVVAATATAAVVTTALETSVSEVLAALGDWEFQSVSAPYILQTGGKGFLAADILAQLDLTP